MTFIPNDRYVELTGRTEFIIAYVKESIVTGANEYELDP